MRLGRSASLEVGALGRLSLPAGWYAYVGSARRGLQKRVARHCAPAKNRRWHVDFLSTAPRAEPVGAVLVPGEAVGECELNRLVGELTGGSTPVPGFGASDCREGCPAHLWFSATAVSTLEIAGLHPESTILIAADGEVLQSPLPGPAPDGSGR